ncbi:MAG TPA: SAM-dependent methyltransferase [Gemmatimonadota bacterium]|jgi:predicted methyltransferase
MILVACRFRARRASAAVSGVAPIAVALVLAAALAGPLRAQAAVDLTAVGRPAEEVARDATSKPLEVYAFLEIEPGDAVADLIAGGGYNTAILTHVVGPEGVVFSQNGRRNAIAERVASGDLKGRANVVVFQDLTELPADSLDVALTVRNYHDLAAGEIPAWLANVRRALKPGGILGVIDVRTKPGAQARPEDLHRISEDLVVKEVTGAGFELVERSNLLANPNDTYESAEFENREGTDRMLLKFRKPAAEAPAG